MTETNPYTFVDNPTESGVAVCDTDILNDDIMCLKWMHDHISFRNIGEIVPSTIPLTDAGLHLLDGALISGSGSYGAFVDYIADLYNNTTSKYSNVIKFGSVVDTDGVLSGFSASNYAKLPMVFNPSTNTWEIVLKYKCVTGSSEVQDIFNAIVSESGDYGIHLQQNTSNKLIIYLSSNGSSWDIAQAVAGSTTLTNNTIYYIKIEFTGSAYKVYLSSTGAFEGEETTDISITNSSSLCTMNTTFIGTNGNASYRTQYVLGSIDLNESYINVDGSRWWTGRQKTGFTDENEWQQTVTDYGICGKFVYDSVNNTVRLPKWGYQAFTKPNISTASTLGVRGNGLATGFTNGSNNAGLVYTSSNGHGFAPNTSYYGSSVFVGSSIPTSGSDGVYGLTTDSTKSGIVVDLPALTNPYGLDCYYYIVIATTAKTDIQVDIDEIATDLNGKADVDLTNVNNSGTSRIAHNVMPSVTYDDLTIGAGEAIYTAPADGWFAVYGTSNSENNIGHGIYAALMNSAGDAEIAKFASANTGNSGQDLRLYIPVRKGGIYKIGHGRMATIAGKFIYAVGSEWEAS